MTATTLRLRDTATAFSEDVLKRFEAYGWDTQEVADGNDVDAIQAAIAAAKKSDKPSIIKIETKIGYGAPNKQGKASYPGAPFTLYFLRFPWALPLPSL